MPEPLTPAEMLARHIYYEVEGPTDTPWEQAEPQTQQKYLDATTSLLTRITYVGLQSSWLR